MKIKFYYSDSVEGGSSFYDADENTAFMVNFDEYICSNCLREDDQITGIFEPEGNVLASPDTRFSRECFRCGRTIEDYESIDMNALYYSDSDRNVGDC